MEVRYWSASAKAISVARVSAWAPWSSSSDTSSTIGWYSFGSRLFRLDTGAAVSDAALVVELETKLAKFVGSSHFQQGEGHCRVFSVD